MAAPSLTARRAAELIGTPDRDRPAYRFVADTLRLLIADGRIAVGTRLPSERDLTGALGLSRTTVSSAYAVLRESGYVASRRGSGSVAALPSGVVRRDTGLHLSANVPEGTIDLTCAALRAPAGMTQAAEAAIAAAPDYLCGSGYVLHGIPELREVIAARYTERGLPTSADEVLVTTGAVVGTAIAARALLSPGDPVVMETPTYPNIFPTLRELRSRISAFPVEPTGWDIDTAVSTVRASGARAAYLLPDFHNPTGNLMPDEQRATLARALGRAKVTAIVDETVAELGLDHEGPMPLPFGAHHADTVSVGSASKSHWGGLRIGWVRASGPTLERLAAARVPLDIGAPVIDQLVLLELMKRSPGITAERRAGLVSARDTLTGALEVELPEFRFVVPRGGLCVWIELPAPVASEVTLAAEDAGLLVASGPRFAAAGGLDRWIRMPYVLPPADLVEAVSRLAVAWRAVRAGATPARRRGGSRQGPLVA
ncbi:PLP-dependent aminotransferase family protein [Knoellia subterranea]|uniref:GntR family transcriptional regulator n=1 Tax=Knoellia subterranea KCTC 19937 TaxID=1385521 RepID=A0A0A0JP38_9MICO|nr:PLP-dependent aminotransferase family protein [Knoellia subterranea]KGN39190.1 GntR family transcriptional regulator [Knoellia subterranea KCTC 19937]